MSYINNIITVDNEKALCDALKKKYGLIYVEGDICEKIKKELNSHKFKKGLKGLSVVSTIVGIAFWPLFVAGGLGLFISKDNFKNYTAEICETHIALEHKNFMKKI